MSRSLNNALLPKNWYALAEYAAGSPNEPHDAWHASTVGLKSAAPQTRVFAEALAVRYSELTRRISIRHASDNRVVALIELVTSGNKAGVRPYRAFLDNLLGAIDQGVHLLLVDLYPPTRRDPNGIHGSIWGELTGEDYAAPLDADRTLAAYSAGLVKTAYVEPVAVGQTLRDMPLFLTPDGEWHVEVPLEATYQAAYEPLPRFYRDILDAPAATT